jgi:5'(3')-deoxyribonucleotidase
MKQRPILGIDIDDVLFPFVHEFVKFANTRLNTVKTVNALDTYSLEKAYGISYATAIELINELMLEEWIEKVQPLDYQKALVGLQELSKYFELHLITARLDIYEKITRDWVNTFFPNVFTDIHHCSFLTIMPTHISKISKADKCREIGAIGLIDDSPANIVDCYNAGLITILFGKYKWQRELPRKIKPFKAKTWEKVVELIPDILEMI